MSLFFLYLDIITSACWGFGLPYSYLITAANQTDAELCHQETVNRNTQQTRRIIAWRGGVYELLLSLVQLNVDTFSPHVIVILCVCVCVTIEMHQSDISIGICTNIGRILYQISLTM